MMSLKAAETVLPLIGKIASRGGSDDDNGLNVFRLLVGDLGR